MISMKKFFQRLGIIAASGLVFGGLAGAAFTGVKSGTHYAMDALGEKLGIVSSADNTQTKSNGSKAGTSTVNIGNSDNISVSVNGDSKIYDVADLTDSLMPSIVSITSKAIYQNPYAYFYGGSTEQTVTGAGSGIIIGEDDDRFLIATNNHVVEGSESLMVGLNDGTDVAATIVGTDSSNDLAVVEVKKSDLSSDTLAAIKVAELGDSTTVRVGEPALAIGNALGYGQSLTVGYISALNKEITINDTTINMIQTDAAINEGNSGGALFNLQGQVIGINSAKASNYNNNVEGMGYAIPISEALPIIQDIIDGKQTSGIAQGSAYMGIQGKDLSAYDAASFNMPEGVYLIGVVENGPAAQAGLHSGDIITSVDGKDISGMSGIKSILAKKNPGDTITVKISRSDENGNYSEQELSVTLGSYTE